MGISSTDGTGRTRTKGGEGAAHDGGNLLDAADGASPLDEAVEDAEGDLLLYAHAHAAQGVLAREQKDGDVVGEGAGDARQGVGSARARAAHSHADLACGPGIAVGDLDSLPLVAGREGCYGRVTQGRPEGR